MPFESEYEANYNAFVAKGCRCWQMLLRKESSPKTDFTAVAQRETWGWTQYQENQNSDSNLKKLLEGNKEPLRSVNLGITTADGAKEIPMNHKAEVEVDGITYGATGASYRSIFWPAAGHGGAIVSFSNFGPAFFKQWGKGGDTPIELRRLEGSASSTNDCRLPRVKP